VEIRQKMLCALFALLMRAVTGMHVGDCHELLVRYWSCVLCWNPRSKFADVASAERARRALEFSPEPESTEDMMPHFMIRWQFTSTSAKALVGKPNDRTGAAKALVEGFGGKLASYYLALGEYDGVAICEFPNNTAAVACSMSATATGGFSRFETTTLLTAQEAEAAMKQANQTKTEYKPPGWGGSPI
jgi:uncharacterized protein with GYD domain